MKKLLILLFLLPTLSFSQIIINQEVVEASPYQVGDTITIRYTLQNLTGQPDFRYFWLRLQYSNKHLQLVPNSTVFTNATTRQTYFYQWVGYRFNQNPNIGVGELNRQLNETVRLFKFWKEGMSFIIFVIEIPYSICGESWQLFFPEEKTSAETNAPSLFSKSKNSFNKEI